MDNNKSIQNDAAKWFASKSYSEQHSLSDKYFESRNPSLLTLKQVQEIYISEMEEELKKCRESPYYFFTNYVTIDGIKAYTNLTEKEFNNFCTHLINSRR